MTAKCNYINVEAAPQGCRLQTKVNGVKKFLGYFDTSDEAARREAELKYGFHSNRGTNKAAYVKKR